MFFKCTCEKPPFYFDEYEDEHEIEDLGIDSKNGEVSINKCKKCGSCWLKYLIEEPQYRKSGRWWRVRINNNELKNITLENAKDYIMNQDFCFAGGSFYEQGVHKKKRPIIVK